MSSNDSDFGTFLIGFVIGGLAGAAAALLLAPQSGEETRTIIREKSIELKDQAGEVAGEAKAKAEQAIQDARLKAEQTYGETKSRASELTDKTRQKAADLQKRGQVVLEEQRSRIESAIEAGKKAADRKRQELSGDKDDAEEAA